MQNIYAPESPDAKQRKCFKIVSAVQKKQNSAITYYRIPCYKPKQEFSNKNSSKSR